MMRLAGYQPQYFPRLHYFARMLQADIFEFSDSAQYVKKHVYVDSSGAKRRGKSYQADAEIKLGNGRAFLTVPAGQHERRALCDTPIAAGGWERKHLKSLALGYARASQWGKLSPQLEVLLDGSYRTLAELNVRTVLWAIGVLSGEIDQAVGPASLETVNAWLADRRLFRLHHIACLSATPVPLPDAYDDATTWIIGVCRHFSADEYVYGGTSAAAYMDFERFATAGITTVEQQWVGAPYTQQFPRLGFMANLSILDLLMNVDPAEARLILAG